MAATLEPNLEPNLEPRRKSDSEAPQWQAQGRDRILYCIQHVLDQYLDQDSNLKAIALNPNLQPHWGQLKTLAHKIQGSLLQVGVLGFVSRGKSALLNALLEEPILPIGALNGVTQWPRSVVWTSLNATETPLTVEFVDTPGLGEVGGQNRAEMAMEIAKTVDVILFVIAGKPNPEECQALQKLLGFGKPLLLISNKADLYPDLTPHDIWSSLDFGTGSGLVELAETNILCASANPSPVKVRNEWPDGHVTEDWQVKPPKVDGLRTHLELFLQRESLASLYLNVLQQVEQTQLAIAQAIQRQHSNEEQVILKRLSTIKAMGVAIAPFWWMDLPLSFVADLLLVRSLVKLYQLPTTRHNVETLWRAIFFGLLGLMLCELASGVFLGLESFASGNTVGFGTLMAWVGTAVLQGFVARKSSQKVAQIAQEYLICGSSWAPEGSSQIKLELQQQCAYFK